MMTPVRPELVQKICDLTKVEFKDIVEETEDRLGKYQSYLLSSDNIRNNFSWNDNTNLDIGLNQTLSWIDQNLSILKSMPMDYKHKK